MKKSVFLSLLLCIAVMPSEGPVWAADGSEPEAPNVIFILTDDLGWGDLGSFYQEGRREQNKPWLGTPHLDDMANEGAKLMHHYTAAPVCAPSRASLLLGVSQGHSNVRNNQFDKALADNHTLATVLKNAGYATAAIGKWGLQGKSSDWPAHPLNRGFDHFLGYIRHGDGHEHYPKEGVYRGRKEVYLERTNITPKLDKSYTADLWTAGAKKWITEQSSGANSNRPFFLYLAYDTPHAVMELPTQEYPEGGGLEGGMQWTGEPGKMINTASGKVDSWIHPDYADATYDHDNDPSTEELDWPDVYKRYATSTRRIDNGVGDLVKLLEDLDIASNTLIVFTSDNGPTSASYLKEPFRPPFFENYGPFDGIKRDTWEGGIRMPTVAYWPGHIPENNVITTPNTHYDWLATFAEAAGLPAPANTDGVSLLPSLTRKGEQEPSRVYVEYKQGGRTPRYDDFEEDRQGRRRREMQMIRLGDHVGVRYDIQSAEDAFEIYNVAVDPSQKNNLAENPDKYPKAATLQKRMKQLVLQRRMPNETAKRPYDSALVPPSGAGIATQPGLQWKAFEGEFPWVPKITGLQASATGTSNRPDATVGMDDHKVLAYSGYLEVPKDGAYSFHLTSDSRALLRLNEATVIDADYGYKGGTERSATIRLKAGKHAFRLHYLKSDGEPVLDLKWKGPGIPKQPIPAGHFSHGDG